MRNNFMRKQTRINELASGIDVQLKKRRDTLTKLLDATKGYMKYEKSLLTDVTKIRKMNITPKNRNEAGGVLDSAFGRLLAVAENYPDLKANNSVIELMDQAAYIEREVSASRRLYNSEVRSFNTSLFI
jgi:LemA protein